MKRPVWFILACVAAMALSRPLWARMGGNPNPRPATTIRGIPQTVTPPFMYDPHEDLYEWKIKDHPDDPCYYDEAYGQWVGDCYLYQTAPGYSITVPNRIQR